MTVVIPVWGAYVELLPEAIASVRDGASAEEVIVVDNASAPSIAPIDGCQLVRSEVRLSRGAARNLGLSHVATEYVVFLDADDLLLPGALPRLIDGLASRPDAQAFVGRIVEADGAPHRMPRVLSRALARAPRLFAWVNAVWSLAPLQGCAIMRTESVRTCGAYPDASSGEDWVLGASLAFRGPIVFDGEPMLVYRLRPDSPGMGSGTSNRVLVANARRVRDRLRSDPGVGAGRAARTTLSIAQLLAVVVVRPVVRGVRGARQRAPAPAARLHAEPVRVLRVIARLNIGGPAIQAITLTKRLESLGYATTLVRGREGPREGSMDDLAAELGVEPMLVPTLRRDPGPADLLALARLVWIMRARRPHIVHTHAAKAGTLGRLAALIAFPNRRTRPVLVHTFHGHSLTGYFSQRTEAVYKTIERLLARRTDTLIAVSQEVQDELVELGVAEPDRFEVVPLGFDLAPFAADTNSRARARRSIRDELAIPASATVVTLIARLVPIKRVDRFLAAALLLQDLKDTHFVVVGDGELSDSLRTRSDAGALDGRLVWAGFRRDMPSICFASDIVALTSESEGTPVSLIEAHAAAVPVVATDVGGVRSVVQHGTSGWVIRPDDVEGFAAAIRELALDRGRARQFGVAGRDHVRDNFTLDRLQSDLDRLYTRLLDRTEVRTTTALPPLAGLLRCVSCGSPVTRVIEPSDQLQCVSCGAAYRVANATPRMLRARTIDRQKQRTARTFAYEWKRFGRLRTQWKKNFTDYLRPMRLADLRDQLLLDVGAGSGRHSFHAQAAGARVVAVDLSDAIEVARDNLPSDVLTVQADLDALPFAPETFDVVMSIGVLHHMADPEAALRRIVPLARRGGQVHVYVYRVPRRAWHRAVLGGVSLARTVTTRLPQRVLLALCYPLSVVLFLGVVEPYRLLRRLPLLHRIADAFPLQTYADYPFGVLFNDQFDRFSAPIEHRFTRTGVAEMLANAGLQDVVILEHHGWIAHGRRC